MQEELEKDMTPKLLKVLDMRYCTEKSKKKYRYGLYECQYCGKEFETVVSEVKTGKTKSCGCRRPFKIHGLRSHRFYHTWNNMIQRCTNSNDRKYKDYGARGIIVCQEWLDVATFIDWAEATYPNINNYTLDRIDINRGYTPDNCRWADKTMQSINQRISVKNTSGFVGVHWNKPNKNWVVSISFNNIKKHIGSFPTTEEAVQARDNYILENKLPHKLSTDYIKDNK